MGLTRIRAEQISDIDYKQAVRVITLSNVNLDGGAPSLVDGVSLVAGDRILVNGQSNAAQNGLYQVQTLGTGENGTWARTSDGNQDGEIQPGMVVMVTQGTQYADTPWKLITNGVINIGVTELIFTENYSLAFGNIFANGTAVVANVVSAPITFAAGENVSIIGNNITKTVTISATGGGGGGGSSIVNGTSNVDIATANANITMSVAGTSNVVVVSATGITVQGNVVGNGIPITTVSTTPPADPEQGDIWIDSDTAIQYIYFTAGGVSQWAEMEAQVSVSGGTGGSTDFENISSNVLPSANVTYNLGSSANRWNDLWLANSTIYIGEATISATGGNLELPATVQIGNVTLQDSGNSLILPDDTIIGSAGITLPNNGSFGFRNRIINGSMAIDQRNEGAAQTITAAAALAYTVDRWYAYCTGANVTGEQVAGSGESQYRYQFTGAASVTKIGFAQRIEDFNCFDMNDNTATLSVDLANSLLTTVTWTASYANTTNSFGTLASPTVTQIATGTFTVTSSVTRYTTQITIPSAATTGIQIEFSVGAQTSGTWTIGDVQLERGSAATPFERRPVGAELALCQRYYFRVFRGATGIDFGSGFIATTTLARIYINFPVSLRTFPSALETTGTASDYSVRNLNTTTTCSAVPALFGGGTQTVGGITLTVASGLTAGQGCSLRPNATAAYVAWSVEL